LNFELRAWTDRFERSLALRSEMGLSVYNALAAAGIEIPFPQRDVHVKGAEAGLEGVLREQDRRAP